MARKEDFFTDGEPDFDKLFKSYENAEKKIGETKAPPKTRESIKATDLAPYFQEFQTHGQLSDASYKNLEGQFGIERGMVDEYIAGQAARREQYVAGIHSAAGGKESFERLVEWAKETLSDDERKAFAAQVDSGDAAAAGLAVKNLMARQKVEGGTPAAGQVEGGKPAPGQVLPFTSVEELTKAMGDEKMDVDAQYTEQVMQRAAATPNDILNAKVYGESN